MTFTTKDIRLAVLFILNRYNFSEFRDDLSEIGIPTASESYVTEKWSALQKSPVTFLLLGITGGNVMFEKIIERAKLYYSD